MAARIVISAVLFSLVVAWTNAQEPEVIKAPPERQQIAGKGGTAKIAHIRLAGSLDESPVSQDSLFGAVMENFKMQLDRIQKASKDADVQGILIHLDGIE